MYIESSSAEDIATKVTDMIDSDSEIAMILLGEEGNTDVHELIRKLNKSNIQFFGGIFPGLIYGTGVHHSGAILQKFPLLEKPELVKGLDDQNFKVPDFEGRLFEDTDKKHTLMILIDGMTANITQLLHRTFNNLGNSVNYLGAGAGSSHYEQKQCIFTPEGIFKDAAVIVPIEMETGLGVSHGLEFVSGPVLVTRSGNNAIQELNWKNAYQEYKGIIEDKIGKKWSDKEFSEHMDDFALGIYCKDKEYIARVITNVSEKGELICAGEMPENAALSILRSKKDNMIAAASKAAQEAIYPERKARNSFIVECVGRYKFLGDGFDAELGSINSKITEDEAKPEGVLSVGEISSYIDGILEFFNFTVVVGRFYE